jgi:predicted amidohydrolase
MKICIAQNKPVIGDIPQNIENHFKLLELTQPYGPEIVIFPELSIIGYEFESAVKLSTDINDSRFNPFQNYSDLHSMIIGIGVPIQEKEKVCISMILFQPNKNRELYSKKYLHPDETLHFTSGQTTIGLLGPEQEVALAICYEISVPAHARNVHKCGAKIYIASVAKFETGIEPALQRLSDIGNDFSLTVLMANSVGQCGENVCAGRSSIWDTNGLLLDQLHGTKEGILLIDTDTKKVINKTL